MSENSRPMTNQYRYSDCPRHASCNMGLIISRAMLGRLLLLGLFFFNALQSCIGDICETCACSQDPISVVNCRQKLGTDDLLHYNLLTLRSHKMVQMLVLSNNSIAVLPESELRQLNGLHKLDLSQNLIKEIHTSNFIGLTQLEFLNLSDNRLTILDSTWLNTITSLSNLNLSHNYIDAFVSTPGIDKLNVSLLDLSYNNITNLPGDFFISFTRLQYLDLSFNKISSISTSALSQLYSLTTLRLNNNYLTLISPQILPKSLTELHCGYNKIIALPYELSNVQTLNFEYNNLSQILSNVTLLEKLEFLNVSGNMLSGLPNVEIQALQVLDISDNNLTAIPLSLSVKHFPLLSDFRISKNPLKELKFPSELRLRSFTARNMSSLSVIDMGAFLNLESVGDDCVNITVADSEKLTFIHEDALKHLNVCFLDLSNNNFAHIPSILVELNHTLKMSYGVNLQGNPFHCNCALQWMLNDLVPQLYSKQPGLLVNLRCSAPLPLSRMRMVHWYKWQERIFCEDVSKYSAKMTVEVANVLGRREVSFETSTGLLAVVGAAITLLVFLVLGGIMLTRRLAMKRSRRNRRF